MKKRFITFAAVLLIIVTLCLLRSPLKASADPWQLPPVISNLSVHAFVPPTVADFQFAFNTDSGSPVHQDQTLTYQITYGASSSAGLSTHTVLVVHYSDDKGPDKAYLVDYVIGSAINGYGNTQPVIDLQNRTITWDIPSLPEGTMDQMVTFQLKANSSFKELKKVSFTSHASMSNEYVAMPEQSIGQEYLFDPSRITPGPTPTGKPAAPTPTPPFQNGLRILDISFSSLSPTEATVVVSTNKLARASIKFGKSPKALSSTVQTTRYAYDNALDLRNLTPDTTYYFQATVVDRSGKSFRSDIYTFKTPQLSQKLTQLTGEDAVIIISGETILLSDILKAHANGSGFVILPTQTNYQLVYTFGTIPPPSSLDIIIRTNERIDRRVTMTPKDAKTFIAQLQTGDVGVYEIIVIQTDEEGNVVSRKVSNLKIIPPLRILEEGSDTPIGDARVLLKSLDGKDLRSIRNPSFTDRNGEDKFLLLPGRYLVEVSAFGHESKAVDFTLGEREGEEYPTIHLKSNMFDLTYLIQILRDDLIKIFVGIIATIKELASSIRTFHIAAMTILLALVSLAFLLFHIRTNIWTREILPFFLFYFAFLRKKHKERYLFGYILDENGSPVSNARVEVIEHNAQTAIEHTTSTKAGSFRLPNIFKEPYVIFLITKDGHPVVRMAVPTDTKKAIIVRMKKETPKAAPVVLAGIKHVAGGFFEIALILSLISELLFIEAFGVARTLPFIALSLFNLALWIFYQKEHTRQL